MLGEYLHNFTLAFIPVFVAMDPVGIIPIYMSFTDGLLSSQKKRATVEALLSGGIFAFLFLFVGRGFFKVLGITANDFKVAGGLLLLVLSVQDILSAEKEQRKPNAEAGIVPLGIPLIVGPAVLTTELMLLDIYGVAITTLALFANLLVCAIAFVFSESIRNLFGKNGIRAISKIVALLLSAMAVMMIRNGLMGFI